MESIRARSGILPSTMPQRQIALLRGINLGQHNRIAMPALREHLTALGYGDVQTVVASGNVVLDSDVKPAQLERDLQQQIADAFDVDTPVIVRTATQMAKVVRDNPFPDGGGKELHVLFLSKTCPAAPAKALEALDLEPEQLAVRGREVYCWYRNGMQNSPMAKALGKHLKKEGTDRNWNTVLKLVELTRGG
jgi:uncharacterized protein (DUF1697 family)